MYSYLTFLVYNLLSISLILEYISIPTGIDISEIKNSLTYEYVVITPPIVRDSEVTTNNTIDIIKNRCFIVPIRNQFLPCKVDS